MDDLVAQMLASGGGGMITPAWYGTDTYLWLESDINVAVDGSQNMLTWGDVRGSGCVFTGQAGGYPVKTASQLNGRPGILHGSQHALMTAGAATIAPPYTCISIMKSASAVGTNIFGPYDGTTVAHGLAHSATGQFQTIQSAGWSSDVIAIADGTEAAGCVFRMSSNATASMNGVAVSGGGGSNGTFTFTNGTSDLCRPVAASTYDFLHLIIKRVIDPNDLKPYIAWKWNLTFS